jgi:FtsH-binding integral membrane protein
MFHQSHNAGFGRFDRPLNFEALGKFGDLTPKVQRHLMQVYATLSSGLLAMALGVFLDYKFYVSGTLTQILAFAMIVGLTFVAGPIFCCCPEFSPRSLILSELADMYNRLALFHAVALLMGCNMSPLISSVAMFHPEIVITAVMATCAVFACFSAAALLAKRRHFLYLGGILGSFLSLLCMFRSVDELEFFPSQKSSMPCPA